MGRPRLYFTSEERGAAIKASAARSRSKHKNVTIDADLLGILNGVADALAAQFGFRPTLSQTLRHLLKDFTPKSKEQA